MKRMLPFSLLATLALCSHAGAVDDWGARYSITTRYFIGDSDSTASSDSIAVAATVVVPLTQTTLDATLSFPDVQRGSHVTVNPLFEGSDATAHVLFTGDEGEAVSVSVSSPPMVLAGSDASRPPTALLTWGTGLAWSFGTSATRSLFASGSELRLQDDNDDSDLDGFGSLHIWVGGELSPGALQQRGEYLCEIIVTCSYLN